jgi:hypothetical protein
MSPRLARKSGNQIDLRNLANEQCNVIRSQKDQQHNHFANKRQKTRTSKKKNSMKKDEEKIPISLQNSQATTIRCHRRPHAPKKAKTRKKKSKQRLYKTTMIIDSE